jgi:hypothetical protein
MARTQLPTSNEALRDLVVQQQRLIDEQAEKIAYLEEWKRLIDSQRFASKSEKASRDQFPLFNEPEVEAGDLVEESEDETISVPAHTRKKRGRRPLPEFLPVREILSARMTPVTRVRRSVATRLTSSSSSRRRSRSCATCDPSTRARPARKA